MSDLEAADRRPTLFGVVGGGTVFAFEPGEIGAGRTESVPGFSDRKHH